MCPIINNGKYRRICKIQVRGNQLGSHPRSLLQEYMINLAWFRCLWSQKPRYLPFIVYIFTWLKEQVESEIQLLLCTPWHRAVSSCKERHIFLIYSKTLSGFLSFSGKLTKAIRSPWMNDYMGKSPTLFFFKSVLAILGSLLLLKSL